MSTKYLYQFIIKFLRGIEPPTPPTPPDPPIPPDPPVPPVPPEPVPPTPVDPGTGSIAATGDLTLSIILICLAVAICAFCAFVFIRSIRKTYGVANVKTIASLSFGKISLTAKTALIAIPLTILLAISMLCYTNAYADNNGDGEPQVVYAWVYDDSIVIDPVYTYASFSDFDGPISFVESQFTLADDTNPDIVDYKNMLAGSWLTVSGLDGTIFTGWASEERTFYPYNLNCIWPGQFTALNFELSGVNPYLANWLIGQDVFAVNLIAEDYVVPLTGDPTVDENVKSITNVDTWWPVDLSEGKSYNLFLWQNLRVKITPADGKKITHVRVGEKEIYPDWFGIYNISLIHPEALIVETE